MARNSRDTENEITISAQKQQIDKLNLRMSQKEDEYANSLAHMQKTIADLKKIEEKARALCQSILDKDNRGDSLGENRLYSAIATLELIDMGSRSYKKYCTKRTQDMKNIMDYAETTGQERDALQDRVRELEKQIQALTKSCSTPVSGDREEQIRAQISGKATIGGTEVGNVFDEPDDDEVMTGSQVRTIVSKSAPVRENNKKPLSALDIESDNEVRLILENILPNEKTLITLIGEGMSVAGDIKAAASSSMGVSTAHKYLKSLAGDGFLEETININFPGTKNCSLFRLTRKGRSAYRLITGKEANEPEMDRILRAHATLEHGYGIRACYQLLERSDRYESINMFADRIKTPDGTQGYIPDLVCTGYDSNGNKFIDYFEFERLKETDSEYFAKFGKMSMITDQINVIVANPTEHDRAQKLLAAWANAKKGIPGYAKKVIRLTNYNKIRDSIDKGKPFRDWWYMTDYVKDFKPPLGYTGPLGEGV